MMPPQPADVLPVTAAASPPSTTSATLAAASNSAHATVTNGDSGSSSAAAAAADVKEQRQKRTESSGAASSAEEQQHVVLVDATDRHSSAEECQQNEVEQSGTVDETQPQQQVDGGVVGGDGFVASTGNSLEASPVGLLVGKNNSVGLGESRDKISAGGSNEVSLRDALPSTEVGPPLLSSLSRGVKNTIQRTGSLFGSGRAADDTSLISSSVSVTGMKPQSAKAVPFKKPRGLPTSSSTSAIAGSLPAHALAGGQRARMISSGRSMYSIRPQADVETSYGSYVGHSLHGTSVESLGTLALNSSDSPTLAAFCCHNTSCRKPLALDRALLDMDPSFFVDAGLVSMAEVYSTLLDCGAERLSALFATASQYTNVLWPLCTSCARKIGQRKVRALETLNVELAQQRRVLQRLRLPAETGLAADRRANKFDDTAGHTDTGLVSSKSADGALITGDAALAALSGDADAASLSLEEMEALLADLQKEERHLQERVKRVRFAATELARDAATLQRAEMAEAQLERDYWRSFAEFAAQAERCAQRQALVSHGLSVQSSVLDALISTHSLNDAFHIWHDGHFGTINRFRLGRLPSQPVDWHELNAAWGLAAHLLHCLQQALRVKFRAWKVLPHGSFSRIQRRSDDAVYELYGSSDISLGRLFWYRRFDQAMVGFLQCIAEIGQYAESRDASRHFKLPHAVEKDRIGEGSIRSQFNNEEAWTKALKCTLTNLKYIAAFVALDNVSRAKKARARSAAQASAAGGKTEGTS